RGSGTAGLSGMPTMRADREGLIVRPLLQVSRHDVVDYLGTRDLPYRLDSSNASAKYRRNRVRHELVPLLRSFNPRIVEILARNAGLVRADADILEQIAAEGVKAVVREKSP